MKRARSRILTGLLFCLISLGQAYPFSVAWGMYQKSHACSCQTAVVKPCDCNHGVSSTQTKKKFSCHEQKTEAGPRYSAAPCGAATEARSLNFRGETCLPRIASFWIIEIETRYPHEILPPLPQILTTPEAPPPKA